jgi:hypothetical protein
MRRLNRPAKPPRSSSSAENPRKGSWILRAKGTRGQFCRTQWRESLGRAVGGVTRSGGVAMMRAEGAIRGSARGVFP